MADTFGSRLLKSRWLVRLPIGLFRIGLGFLFTSRLMLLEHRGRKSGARRFVVLEVLAMPSRNELVLASGFGRRAQWFQNLQANPSCRVSVGFLRHVDATATVLDEERARPILANYQAAYPVLWKKLNATLRELQGGNEHFELPLVLVRMTPPS